jgi:G:T-mismatch repair DNA endonuclease (very short patch repair protein)
VYDCCCMFIRYQLITKDGSPVPNVVYWRKCTAQNFKYCERTVIELKTIMFKSLYVWMEIFLNFWICVFLLLPSWVYSLCT